MGTPVAPTQQVTSYNRVRSLGLVLSVGAIAILTLAPSRDPKLPPTLTCIICGERGLADFLRNVILFVPLGIALGTKPRSWQSVLLLGALLSAGIEVAQLFIPGRDSSVSDVVSNSLGAGLGALVLGRSHALSRPERRTRMLPLFAAGWPIFAVAITGFLFQPVLPRSPYFALWTPAFAHMPVYAGRIREARVAAVSLTRDSLRNTDLVRALLQQRAPLTIALVTGPAPARLAPIFEIADGRQREILLVGAIGQDLLFRYYMRASAARLEQPSLRMRAAFAGIEPGDTATVIRRWPGGVSFGDQCLSVGQRVDCDLGFTAGRGWSLLLYPGWFSSRILRLLDLSWIAALFAPLGFLARKRVVFWTGVVGLVALGMIPALTHLRPTTGYEWLAAGFGAVVGVVVGWALETGRSETSSAMQRSMRA